MSLLQGRVETSCKPGTLGEVRFPLLSEQPGAVECSIVMEL